MLVKILGGIDLIAGFVLILSISSNISHKILLVFGMILLVKASLGLLKDFPSWIDFLGGITFLISIIIFIPNILIAIIAISIIQKGVFSFL